MTARPLQTSTDSILIAPPHTLSLMLHGFLSILVAAQLLTTCNCSPITSFNARSKLSPLTAIQSINVVRSSTGITTTLSEAISGKKSLLVFLTHLGDLSSWELAQKLLYYIPQIERSNVNLVAVAPGATMENAKEFCLKTGLPIDKLFVDFEAVSYEALEFEKGFMPAAKISPYLKLLPMLMGIQSEGTIGEVLRGYVGDKTAPSGWIKSTLRLVEQDRFDVLGTDYQRPMELASVRLQNMMDILPSWDKLIPGDLKLITQQGGAYVIGADGETLFQHKDTGILKYVNVEEALAAAGVIL